MYTVKYSTEAFVCDELSDRYSSYKANLFIIIFQE